MEECLTNLVEARLKLVGWMEECREDVGRVRNMLKASELKNKVKGKAYQESLRGKYEAWRDEEVESVEKEWEKFRDIVMECTNDVCGMRRVGGQRRNGSVWWNEEVGIGQCRKEKSFRGMASEKR